MLSEESIWIRNIIKENFSDDDFPLLNIGSSTEEFRKKTQPPRLNPSISTGYNRM